MYSNILGQSNPLSQYLRCSNQKDWPSSPINQDTVEVVNEHPPGEMSKHDQQDIFCKKKMNKRSYILRRPQDFAKSSPYF